MSLGINCVYLNACMFCSQSISRIPQYTQNPDFIVKLPPTPSSSHFVLTTEQTQTGNYGNQNLTQQNLTVAKSNVSPPITTGTL